MVRRRLLSCAVALLVGTVLVPWPAGQVASADTLPARLTDAELWTLSETLSEPNGFFRTDNILSNELYYPEVLPGLAAKVKAGGVYLGVGPEQNFHYIAALRPKMVFITDVRRGNLHAQLMYKALFELSPDRASFVSRLFTKTRPPGLSPKSSAGELMQAFWDVPTGPQAAFDANVRDVVEHLTKTHAFPLSADDVEGIKYVYNHFYWYGPSITYSSAQGGGRAGSMATYAQLMTSTDEKGAEQSFLASEEAFAVLRELESRNMVVPVVGNFGGPRALRAVGKYVRDHGATVDVFYLSNVEQYLRQDSIWGAFCANVASMPLTANSTFIRSQSMGGGGFRNFLGPMQSETAGCGAPGGPDPSR